MWLLENDGDIFRGRRLWLRPGKRYLFGRTSQEAGQVVIADKTISRKHLTIEVSEVAEGEGSNLRSRSIVTIEDLNTKLGTWLNGTSIRGERIPLIHDKNEVKLGNYDKLFRITWHSVVLSFSFSKKELQHDPWAVIRRKLEPNDVKYIAEYDRASTTHVVSKKRNTGKVLQALINGKFIVTDGFMEAIIAAATPEIDDKGFETSALEEDFDANWPDAMKYLPPKAEGPGYDRPDEAFAPDERRQEVFEGYTFIIYEKKRFDDLFPVITSGKGKALFREAAPGETDINEYIRYVKGIAGEKGLGEFEDGSEGRGVVVVRYVPHGEEHEEWYLDFYNQVALRLNHRPIEPRDFLTAILDLEPAQLRRALEIEPTPREPAEQWQHPTANNADNVAAMDVDEPREERTVIEESSPPPPRPRRGRATKSRFKGFDIGMDNDDEDPASALEPSAAPAASQGMFMTQQEEAEEPSVAVRSQCRRPAPPPDVDMMEVMAPTAAAIKRRRIERGEDVFPPKLPTPPPPEEDEVPGSPPTQKGRAKRKAATQAGGRKSKKSVQGDPEDLLDQHIQNENEKEANARAEREELARELAEGNIDYKMIRDLTIVESMEVRAQPPAPRTREQDIQEGRWDPRWNGRKNFKKFVKQGDKTARRPQQRVIMSLEPVRLKEYGIGDDYWLEDGGTQRGKGRESQQAKNSTQAQSQAGAAMQTLGRSQRRETAAMGSDSEDDDFAGNGNGNGNGNDIEAESSSRPDTVDIEAEPAAPEPSRSRKGKAAEKASSQASKAARSTQTRAASSSKRAAVAPPSTEKPAKKRATRTMRKTVGESDDEDEDESDGGLKFRFGKRK